MSEDPKIIALEEENKKLREELQSFVDACGKDDSVVGRLAIMAGRNLRYKYFLKNGKWL